MLLSAAARRSLPRAARHAARSSRQGLAPSSRRCLAAVAQQPPFAAPKMDGRAGPHPQPLLAPRALPASPTRRRFSAGDLPYHVVVGMPALSPTMASGTISKWNVSEGDSFSAGDSLAVIETDKATIDFEAQDDGVVAKMLVAEGGGEIDVGVPIMVTVEEADDAAAFKDFVPESVAPAAAAEEAPTPAAPAAAPAAAATPAEDLPYHVVVGMPALSPTMDAGTISKWNVSEGESFTAGDSIAVIETDKATIDFEAQDDAIVAKLLVADGAGEVAVGVPIMVTVDEEGDVAAFKDFVAGSAPDSAATEASAPAVEEVKAQEPVVAAAPTPAPAAPTPAAPAPAVEPVPATPAGAVLLGGSSWGRLAAERSPLAKALASKQKEYMAKYGSTGHVPIA
ncbi:hypothetical protein ACHAXT_000585 [Thalassiosira profunda]